MPVFWKKREGTARGEDSICEKGQERHLTVTVLLIILKRGVHRFFEKGGKKGRKEDFDVQYFRPRPGGHPRRGKKVEGCVSLSCFAT